MTDTERRVSADEARRDFRAVLNEVEHDHAHVAITRYGQDAAVVVPVGWHTAAIRIIRQLEGDAEALAVHRGITDALHEARRAAGLPDRPEPTDHRVIHHIDGDPTNNDLSNLEIINPRENQ